MPHRALNTILLGLLPPVDAGDVIPDTYVDMAGKEHPVDIERLIELGVAEKVEPPKARRSAPKD